MIFHTTKFWYHDTSRHEILVSRYFIPRILVLKYFIPRNFSTMIFHSTKFWYHDISCHGILLPRYFILQYFGNIKNYAIPQNFGTMIFHTTKFGTKIINTTKFWYHDILSHEILVHTIAHTTKFLFH